MTQLLTCVGRGRMVMTQHPHNPHLKPLLIQDDVDLCRDVNATVRCFAAGAVVPPCSVILASIEMYELHIVIRHVV